MPVPTYLLIPRLTLLVALTALTTAAPVIRADDAPSEPSAASSDAVADAAAEGTSTPSSTAGTETDEAEKAQEAPPTPPPPPPIDQQPYRVLVVLGVAPDPDLNAAVRNQILTGVRERIDSRLGPLWDADVELADWIQPGRRAVLQSLTQEGLNARFLESEFDKVFVATVEAEGIATRLSAREWDKNSQTVTADTSSLNYEPRVVVDRLFAEILAHFRPIAEVEEISEDGNSLEMRIRGGELLPPDAALRPAEVGAYLRPYYRYLNRKKELMKLQDLPWTYLQITEVTRGRMKAEIHSAFKGALASARRRTELMAIGVKIRFDETRIRIYPRGQVDNPLSANRVDVMDRHPTDHDKVEDRQILYTDRSGEVRVPANPEQPLQYIYVMSGSSVLAVVPYIPGEQPRTQLEVPDDAPRLAMEGEIAILEAELIELVARREVCINRALGYARAEEWSKADELMNDVKSLPTRDMLLERLERIRLPATALTRQTKNRVGEARINKMCNEFKDTVTQHLDPDRIDAFQTEIRELKQASGAN